MSKQNQAQVNSSKAAQLFLLDVSSAVSCSVDALSMWSIAGGGAMMAYLISQVSEIKEYVPLEQLAGAGKLYLSAICKQRHIAPGYTMRDTSNQTATL